MPKTLTFKIKGTNYKLHKSVAPLKSNERSIWFLHNPVNGTVAIIVQHTNQYIKKQLGYRELYYIYWAAYTFDGKVFVEGSRRAVINTLKHHQYIKQA